MQKIGMLCAALLLAACANAKQEENTQAQEVPAAMPCSYSCVENSSVPCAEAKPIDNVQKPRVTEIMPKGRPCCDDKNPNAKEVIPDAPEIFVISANRTLRSMLNDKNLPIKNKAKVYVADTINNEPDMPTGIEKGTEALKRGLKNAGQVEITDDREQAQYVLSSEVSWFDTETKFVPAIKYSLGLFDNKGQKLGEWVEILHQSYGDRSWW